MSKVKTYKYRNPLTPKQYIFIKTVSNIFIMLGIAFLLLAFGPIIKDEVWYKYKQAKSQEFVLDGEGQADSVFARFISTKPILIEPVNKDFSLVIEKLGINAPVKADVSVSDEQAYLAALKDGIAHASVSNYPSTEPGNVYLFAHASINFWELGRYAMVFNLLRKLEQGDKVHVFYKGKDYVYEVIDKEVMDGWNTYPITRPVLEPILTLQTCDPPGTTLNRLVVTAKLVEVK